MQNNNNPLSPHLQIYKWQISSLLSITHRIVGVVNILAITIICFLSLGGDSHTATHGAFGALAFGIGTSEVEHVLATQTLVQKKAKNFRVNVNGKLPLGVTSKDVILQIIGKIGTAGGTGCVIEYAGDLIRSLSVEQRMTICNMTIEGGARAGLIQPDQKIFDYLKGRPMSPKNENWDKAMNYWESLKTDEAIFNETLETLFNQNLKDISDTEQNLIRRDKLGFVYQSNNLFSDFTAIENVTIPQILLGASKKNAYESAFKCLDVLGLSARINHLPKDLSGGEQQRVAIARAIINEPKVIIADEPTGNLDKNTSKDVFEHLIDFVYSQKISLIMATHNLELASKSDHQIKLV